MKQVFAIVVAAVVLAAAAGVFVLRDKRIQYPATQTGGDARSQTNQLGRKLGRDSGGPAVVEPLQLLKWAR